MIRFLGLGLRGFPSLEAPLASHSPDPVSLRRRSETRAGAVSQKDLSVQVSGRTCLVSHEEGLDLLGLKEIDA